MAKFNVCYLTQWMMYNAVMSIMASYNRSHELVFAL